MVSQPFIVQVVTVEKALFDGDALELHCAGVDGQLAILPHHEPLITRLAKGSVRVVTSVGEEIFAIHSGVLEVADNKAVVLCSSDVRTEK